MTADIIMRYSKLFGKTVHEPPADSNVISHQLLYQAGFIRESASGRYFFLPLGQRVQNKIIQIIKDEMDKAGAQEMLSPVLHPIELWKETKRTNTTGFELMKVTDRRGAEFALGGTAEEMFVDIVRKFQISYRDLPFNIYQFSNKFRDELRARGGLLRVREFMMKDAYSFDANEEEFKKQYKKMMQTYKQIFQAMELDTVIVESDNGYIGGDYCHEFVVLSDIGESVFLTNEDNSYSVHQDIAKFHKETKNINEELKQLKEVDTKRGTTMEDGVKFHQKPLWQQIKDVLYIDEKGRYILAIIRGDFDVNETKLKHIVKASDLRHATTEEIRNKIHSEPGFISPVGIKDIIDQNVKLIIVADESLRTIKNAYGGANKQYRDLLNINIDRDYKADIEADIALAKDGYKIEDGLQKLTVKKGIEVGNIFQLGYHYTKKMKGAIFTDSDGREKSFYMGCYGIGIGRTMAAIVEKYHDSAGIIWPTSVTPFHVHLLNLNKEQKSFADVVYRSLKSEKIEVLYDDRIEPTAGEKFATADLIGIPIRLVISNRTKQSVEWKLRPDKKVHIFTPSEVIEKVKEIYNI